MARQGFLWPAAIRDFLHYLLIGKPFVTGGKVDNAAIGETVLQDIVLHDVVVPMGVNANVPLFGEAEVNDALEDAASFRYAGNAMDDMIGKNVIHPLTTINGRVSGFGRWQKSEISHHKAIVLNHIAAVLLNVRLNSFQRGVTLFPLIGIARVPHNGFGGRENLHDSLAIFWQ